MKTQELTILKEAAEVIKSLMDFQTEDELADARQQAILTLIKIEGATHEPELR